MIPPKNDEVIFDFILCKMLNINEMVIYADKKLYTSLNDDEDDDCYYKIITLDTSGTIRKYIKVLNTAKQPDGWCLINTM